MADPNGSLPVFDVTKSPYNADRSGENNARTAIQTAINDAAAAGPTGLGNARGGIVFIPVGVYKIAFQDGSGSLELKSNVRIVGEVAQNNSGVVLKPDHGGPNGSTHYPVFKYEGAYITGWSIENIAIDFSGCASATTSSAHLNDVGISISGCYLYDIQNVSVFNAYRAYYAYLATGSGGKDCFMGTVRKLYAKMCRFGIHHDKGTTMTFDHCWVNLDGGSSDASYWKLGWHLGTIYGVTLTSCALEKWYSSGTSTEDSTPRGFLADSCRGLVINSMDVEHNDTNTGDLMLFNNCEVVLNAFRTTANTIRCSNGAVSSLVRAHACSLSISGSSFGGAPNLSVPDVAVGGNAGSVAAALYLTSTTATDQVKSAVSVQGSRIGPPDDPESSFAGSRVSLWNTATGFLDSLSVLGTNGMQNQVNTYGDVLVIDTDVVNQDCDRDVNRGYRVTTGTSNVRTWMYGTGNNANHGGRLQLIDGGVVGAGLRIGSSGDPGYSLHLTNDSAAKPSTSTWTVTSDERTKENLRPFTSGLDVLRQLLLHTWEYNGLGETPAGQTASGVLAQQLQPVLPDAVVTTRLKHHLDDTDQAEYLGVNYHLLFLSALQAIKELDARLAALEREDR